MPDAVETVEAAVDAAVLLFIRVLHSLHIKRTVKIGDTDMGNSTGSTMYMFGAVIVIYIAGMLLYQGFQWIKKKREQKKDEEFRRGDK